MTGYVKMRSWWKAAVGAAACVAAFSVSGGVASAASTPLVLQGTFGSAGSGAGQFAFPQATAVDPSNGDVYVVDNQNSRVQKFDSAGNYLSQFGSSGSGNGQFTSPIGVAVDPASGDVYVVDAGNDRIEEFDSSGNYLAQFGSSGSGNGQFSSPMGVAVDPASSDVYVVDGGNNRVEEFDAAGNYLAQFGSSGSGNGQFSSPMGVAVDQSNSDVYVADGGNNRVEKFDSSGNYLSQFDADDASSPGLLTSPTGVGVDPSNGNVYVSDASDGRVVAFDSSGRYLSEYDHAGSQFALLAASAGGTVYVPNPSAEAVDIVAPGVLDPPTTVLGSEAASHVTTDQAALSASIDPDGVDTHYYFEYVDDADFNPSASDPYSAGNQAPASPGSDIGSAFNVTAAGATATDLVAGTLYHFRVVASNSFGTAYGPDEQFVTAYTGVGIATMTQTSTEVTLGNGYVQVGFDLLQPGINLLAGDLTGTGRYGENVAAASSSSDPLHEGGIFLARTDAGGADFASTEAAGPNLHVAVLSDTPSLVVVRVDGIVDNPADPLVTSSWTLSLGANSRTFRLQTSTRALRPASVAGVRIVSWLQTPSVYGLFQQGVAQMIGNAGAPYFAVDSPLQRVYTLGTGGAFDLMPTDESLQRQTLLLSSDGVSNPYQSGVEEVLAGTYPQEAQWSSAPWASAPATAVTAGQTWTTDDRIAVNDHAFPVGTLGTGPNLPDQDLEAMYTALYASTVGMLNTIQYPGEQAVNLNPETYAGVFNFWDPESWMGVNGLVDTGDPYLINQARTVLEKTGAAIAPDGQVPHHFTGTVPTFLNLSDNVTMTGPNIVWIEAALYYANTTGNIAWLRAHMPLIERALGWLTRKYNPSLQLVKATGPLWIDVFSRINYTSDTNAFMVKLLRDVASAEQVVGHPAAAARDRYLAGQIVEGMNAHLWAGNHYITQLNPNGTIADFGDNDANALAVAFGITSPAQARKVIAWQDGGPCIAPPARAGWVSQVYYNGNVTEDGNTGDSATAMGRVAWADAMARYATGDVSGFQNIIGPIRSDLLQNTWLTERYDCNGDRIRAPYYDEYPDVIAMLLHDDTYGIHIGLAQVELAPFGVSNYNYAIGNVAITYSRSQVDITLPFSGRREFVIHGMQPGGWYQIQSGRGPSEQVAAGYDGILNFTLTVSAGAAVQAILGPAPAGLPTNLTLPSISGSAVQGQALAETHGGWSGSPTGYAYQWERCDGLGDGCQAIGGAVSQSYTLTAADVGSTVRVQEIASNGAGISPGAVSTPTGLVAAPMDVEPSVAQLLASLGRQLVPSGKAARIGTVLARGRLKVSFRALTAGRLVIDWYEPAAKGRKRVLVATGKLTFHAAGRASLTIKLTAAGKRLLEHALHAHARAMKLTATGTFTPRGKPPIHTTKTISLV